MKQCGQQNADSTNYLKQKKHLYHQHPADIPPVKKNVQSVFTLYTKNKSIYGTIVDFASLYLPVLPR
jgi:hypothetical protein